MNDALQRIYDEVPDDEPRSRLEPYRELILQWRRQGRSYRRIQKLLAEKCQIAISYEPLRRFVKRRSRPRHRDAIAEPVANALPMTVEGTEHTTKPSPEERAAQLDRIRSLNTSVSEEQPKPRWTFDPDKPRTNQKQQESLRNGTRFTDC